MPKTRRQRSLRQYTSWMRSIDRYRDEDGAHASSVEEPMGRCARTFKDAPDVIDVH